jgi:antitoxin FitA
MATLTVRGLAAELHALLRIRAARNGRSMEAEVRSILEEQLRAPQPTTGWGSRVHARFVDIAADDIEFVRAPDRPRAAEFDA